MSTVYLGLGTNLGNRESIIGEALRALEENVGTLLKCSTLLQTEPWGFASDNLFINAAASFLTSLPPMAVLEETQRIEKELGRKEKSINGRYSDRLIDIDILFYDEKCIDEQALKIPHPLLQKRLFVLSPLAEIAPDLVHPVERKTIKELKELLENK